MTRLVLFELFAKKLTTVWAPTKKLLVSWQFSGPYGITKYSSGWRKDVVNQCLEFVSYAVSSTTRSVTTTTRVHVPEAITGTFEGEVGFVCGFGVSVLDYNEENLTRKHLCVTGYIFLTFSSFPLSLYFNYCIRSRLKDMRPKSGSYFQL